MGFPLHAYQDRSDNKLYRLQTPQSPMVRPLMYDHYNIDNYPIGTNAVVAVISYTGYDMEDAMVSTFTTTTDNNYNIQVIHTIIHIYTQIFRYLSVLYYIV